MIYITGDCHGGFERFTQEIFPEGLNMTKEDFVIICGDFGGVWEIDTKEGGWKAQFDGHKHDCRMKAENNKLDWLDSMPFTTLFVCGNHENFDRLNEYPVEEWHGGHIHKIRPSIFHLMCGEVFDLQGKNFFHLVEQQAMILTVEFLIHGIFVLMKDELNFIMEHCHTELMV